MELLIGAILGVVCSEAYRWIRSRPRLRIESSFFHRIPDELFNLASIQAGDKRFNEGLTITVTNEGNTQIEDYNIVLRSPSEGTLSLFQTEKAGPLLSGQKREHTCVTKHFKGTKLKDELQQSRWGSKSFLNTASLQIVMKDSDKVVYENKPFGKAVIQYLCTGKDDMSMYWNKVKPWTLPRWYSDRKDRRMFKKMTRVTAKKAVDDSEKLAVEEPTHAFSNTHACQKTVALQNRSTQ